MTAMNADARISLRSVVPPGAPGWFVAAIPALDRVLGIARIDRLYRQHGLGDAPPFEFAARTLEVLEIGISASTEDVAARVPRDGPVIVTCNHPFGGVEALILMRLLQPVRTDVRFLANSGLQVFRELAPMFIATDPLKVSQANLGSIRGCEAHLAGGGLLVIFPAGRVSSKPRGGSRICDARWHRIVGHLACRVEATLLPVFFHGANSLLFQRLGMIRDRFKLFLLPREFLRMRGRTVRIEVGRAIAAPQWRHLDKPGITRLARFMTYALEAPTAMGSPAATGTATATDEPPRQPRPLAAPGDRAAITKELAALPASQRLVEYRQFSVCHARATQIPELMDEIARERERVFREHDEGSGAPRDRDAYDASYVQLFVWDNARRRLLGAYRMGPTDRLRQPDGSGLYLSQMFRFDESIYRDRPPALELGRSFIVPEYQKHHYSLHLLWRGIGRFLVRHARYRSLYGTVSLSRQYDARAIALICDGLIEPSAQVQPRNPLPDILHPEWHTFRAGFSGRVDLPTLSACVRSLDPAGRDIPVLIRHYYRLGARFLCAGIDRNFNDTPGLLLRVDMEQVPPRLLSTYLGRNYEDYLGWRPTDAPGHEGEAL